MSMCLCAPMPMSVFVGVGRSDLSHCLFIASHRIAQRLGAPGGDFSSWQSHLMAYTEAYRAEEEWVCAYCLAACIAKPALA